MNFFKNFNCAIFAILFSVDAKDKRAADIALRKAIKVLLVPTVALTASNSSSSKLETAALGSSAAFSALEKALSAVEFAEKRYRQVVRHSEKAAERLQAKEEVGFFFTFFFPKSDCVVTDLFDRSGCRCRRCKRTTGRE
jgi:hypothetical protein